MSKRFGTLLLIGCLWAAAAVFAKAAPQGTSADNPGNYPALFKESSRRAAAARSAGQNSASLLSQRYRNTAQRLHIIALMVEFNGGVPDTTPLTTGNGLFDWSRGGTREDSEEYKRYQGGVDSAYRFDQLPHYQSYVQQQLEYVKRYYQSVSFNKLTLSYETYPKTTEGDAYKVPQPMFHYSPATKRPKETFADYYLRKTIGIIEFIIDAVESTSRDQANPSPFADIYYDADSTLVIDRDGQPTPVAFLIMHAGASYLTDGLSGLSMPNSQSDMIDVFVNEKYFDSYADTLNKKLEKTSIDTLNGRTGMRVRGKGGAELIVDEFMMCSETSNQDKLNWGIHGILVNQVARQLGIPDLFSTSSAISGIGAFCIMDFAGYSAAQGFIPPWPSAWVRAFMGWDRPLIVPMGGSQPRSYSIKAIGAANPDGSDTTIVLIPLNDHEYFLIENRQRNPRALAQTFHYDTLKKGDVPGDKLKIDNTTYRPGETMGIKHYPFNVNLGPNVTDSSGTDSSNTILNVYNYDVGLPASGILVWHVDEEILRNRLDANSVNADSLYRGVRLVEADGINDLGITFASAFYQAAYDYGGAEDVFPHHTRPGTTKSRIVKGLSPTSRPSTRSNDGSNSYVTIEFNQTRDLPKTIEKTVIGDHHVYNYSDSVFQITLFWDHLVQGWPRPIVPDSVLEPVLCDVTGDGMQELVLWDRHGRVSAFSTQSASSSNSFGSRTAHYPLLNLFGDTLTYLPGDTISTTTQGTTIAQDTLPITSAVTYLDSLGIAASFPSVVDNRVLFPSTDSTLYVLNGIDNSGNGLWSNRRLGAAPSSHVCVYDSVNWALGCSNGRVYRGRSGDTTASLQLPTPAAVQGLSALPGRPNAFATIQADGLLSIIVNGAVFKSRSVPYGIAPYSVVSGDLDRDSSAEIIITDSRQGIWVYRSDTLGLAAGWETRPNGWPAYFSYLNANNTKRYESLIDSKDAAKVIAARSLLPLNTGAPSLADINNDGHLDIVLGGTNGLYAFNYKGVLIYGWPSYLDKRFWLQRGSINTSPVVGITPQGSPLVLFSSPTGGRATFGVTSVDSTDSATNTIYYTLANGRIDSTSALTDAQLDTVLTMNKGLFWPYIMPGGYVDAVGMDGKRPLLAQPLDLPNTGKEMFSYWPFATGGNLCGAPLLGKVHTTPTLTDTLSDLFSVTATGQVYRWQLGPTIIGYTPQQWYQTGANSGRSFAHTGALNSVAPRAEATIDFFSYPNPTDGARSVSFRYKFSAPAQEVRLDIYTYTGHRIYSWRPDTDAARSYPDWNEHTISLDGFGPAVYRCLLEATVGGKKVQKLWKMAVVK
jgi:hypothetical protein